MNIITRFSLLSLILAFSIVTSNAFAATDWQSCVTEKTGPKDNSTAKMLIRSMCAAEFIDTAPAEYRDEAEEDEEGEEEEENASE